MAKTSKQLESLNFDTSIKKLDARDAKLRTYKDRGTSGREAGVMEAIGRGNKIYEAYDRSKDMIERYGKDAPNARSFMAYEGQSGTAKKKAAGGMIKEGSAKDMREDKAMAKKSGMTMKQHEASAADKKHDAPKKMASGGKLKMVEKGGKKVPSFAADGVGKMAMGGAVKKMNYGGGMKTGGTVRGAGAAIRGKRFTGSC